MSDGVQLMLNEDGKAEIYDGTWDIVIHCETEKEFNEAKEKILSMNWIPVTERLPKVGKTVICQCRADILKLLKLDSGGDWYQDAEHAYMSGFVLAWMPLPKPYKEKE